MAFCACRSFNGGGLEVHAVPDVGQFRACLKHLRGNRENVLACSPVNCGETGESQSVDYV